MFYPDEVITEVRMRNDIIDVISEYIRLEKKGQYYFGLCPFHGEKTSSFSVTPSKQIFYCYGCGKAGNVFNFIMESERLTFVDAVKYLAERVNYDLPEGDDKFQSEKARLRKKIIEINTLAARFFFKNLFSEDSKIARNYLINRELNQNIIKIFGIGYSKNNWDDLYKFLIEKGQNREDIIKSGLIIPNKKNGYFDRFRNRIMFPIFDVTGNVIGFGGRTLDNSTPKYMNSPETIVYNKRQSLYNLNLAKKFGREKIIIVEGYMDVVSLYQSDIKNVVASLGTALTEGQARLLKNYSDEVIISYDSDNAGQIATLRGLDVLNKLNVSSRVITILDAKDPDEFIKKNGVEKFRSLIGNSQTLINYKLDLAKKTEDDGSTEGRIKFLEKVAQILGSVKSRVEIEMYIKKISKEYGISEDAIKTEIEKKFKPAGNLKLIKKEISKKNNDIKKRNNTKYEEILLCLLTLDNSIFNHIKLKIGIEDFGNNHNKEIAKYIFDILAENKEIVPAKLIEIVDDEYKGDFAKIIQNNIVFQDNYKAADSLIDKIKNKNEGKRKEEIINLLKEREKNNLTEGDVKKLIRELNMITMKKK